MPKLTDRAAPSWRTGTEMQTARAQQMQNSLDRIFARARIPREPGWSETHQIADPFETIAVKCLRQSQQTPIRTKKAVDLMSQVWVFMPRN